MFYFSAKTLLVDGATKTTHTQNVIAFNFFGFVPPILCEIYSSLDVLVYPDLTLIKANVYC